MEGFLLVVILLPLLACLGQAVWSQRMLGCRPDVTIPAEAQEALFGVTPYARFRREQLKAMCQNVHEMCVLENTRGNEAGSQLIGGIWATIDAQIRGSADMSSLCSGNVEQYTALVKRYFASPIVSGFQDGYPFDEPTKDHPIALWIRFDSFFSLGESCGCRHVPSALHGGVAFEMGNFSQQFQCIERYYGNLQPPQFGARIPGLRVGNGVIFNLRMALAVPTATKVIQLIRQSSNLKGHVCEIGGGTGYIAYYANRFGGIRSYTLIDITAALLTQYQVLYSAFGERVQFLRASEKHAFAKGSITLVHAFLFPEWSFKGCEIVINQDSMPEMAGAIASSYLRRMHASSTVRFFISHNQESIQDGENDYRKLTLAAGFRSVQRNRAWMRQGYVDELYEATQRVNAKRRHSASVDPHREVYHEQRWEGTGGGGATIVAGVIGGSLTLVLIKAFRGVRRCF